jgi:hypothetical protein
MTNFGTAIVLGSMLVLAGCAQKQPPGRVASLCSKGDRSACQSMDDARQLRDAADYQSEQSEPALGFASIPQGLYLPMPIVGRSLAP